MKIKIDWHTADIEIDIYCECGCHFVVYKREASDQDQAKCPACLETWVIKPGLSSEKVLIEKTPNDNLLEVDKNKLNNWK